MFFHKNIPNSTILQYVTQVLNAIDHSNGVDVIVKKHANIRSIRQNRFLMEVCAHIVRFYHETGFMPGDCKKREMTTTGQKEYWKDFFGILETHKLSTKQMSDFIEQIQASMIEQTQGEYQPIIPDSDYLQSLENIA